MGQCCSDQKAFKKKTLVLPEKDVSELAKTTGLDVGELNKYYREFVKDYPSGHLTKKQFQAIYRDFFPDDPKRKNFAEKLFQTYDQNNDGTIDFREFMIALSLISKGTVKQKLALAFDLYDANGDGVLTYTEILDVVKAMYNMAGDPNGIEGVPPAELFAKKLFAELDKDHDGNITVEEFTEVGSQDVTVANLLLAKIAGEELSEDEDELT
ncbi:visinin-like protein 1 [Styela clava]|uniref:visinin-like protein 1 n=1 Tax=Styela clava TaxID=7725 RepID=UPI001939A3E0|nr:visinin-like protein 1 [Styela clava]